MVEYTSLLLPILVSAVAVFIVSSILHMALPWHHGDWKKLPDEGAIQDELRAHNIPPGNYMLPAPEAGAGMKDETWKKRVNAGPNATIILRHAGFPNMGKLLGTWFLHLLVVSALCAFNVAHAAGPGPGNTHRIFHFVALPAFLAYSLALWQDQVWYGKSTATTIRNTIDGLIYALVTAGVFMWMWPKA
jgi:hypothetical protein